MFDKDGNGFISAKPRHEKQQKLFDEEVDERSAKPMLIAMARSTEEFVKMMMSSKRHSSTCDFLRR